jgi:hypothetical protein
MPTVSCCSAAASFASIAGSEPNILPETLKIATPPGKEKSLIGSLNSPPNVSNARPSEGFIDHPAGSRFASSMLSMLALRAGDQTALLGNGKVNSTSKV